MKINKFKINWELLRYAPLVFLISIVVDLFLTLSIDLYNAILDTIIFTVAFILVSSIRDWLTN